MTKRSRLAKIFRIVVHLVLAAILFLPFENRTNLCPFASINRFKIRVIENIFFHAKTV
jgi:hypothetical protein